MIPETRIKHGQHVKCEISGVEGIVSSLALEENGNIRVGIQPKPHDNKTAEAFFTDEVSVAYISEGISGKALPPQDTKLLPGHEVRDTISNFQGTITSIVWYLNGCIHALVTSTSLERGRPIVEAFPVTRLVEKMVALSPPSSPTGGPITHSHARL